MNNLDEDDCENTRLSCMQELLYHSIMFKYQHLCVVFIFFFGVFPFVLDLVLG